MKIILPPHGIDTLKSNHRAPNQAPSNNNELFYISQRIHGQWPTPGSYRTWEELTKTYHKKLSTTTTSAPNEAAKREEFQVDCLTSMVFSRQHNLIHLNTGNYAVSLSHTSHYPFQPAMLFHLMLNNNPHAICQQGTSPKNKFSDFDQSHRECSHNNYGDTVVTNVNIL